MKKLLLTLTLILSFSCSSALAVEQANPVYKLPFSNPSKVIVVKRDNPMIAIKLKSNPSTGFSWFLSKYDPNLLTPVREVYYPSIKNIKDKKPSGEKIIGAGGFSIWYFKINQAAFVVPQLTEINLRYMRPWVINSGQSLVFKVVIAQTPTANK